MLGDGFYLRLGGGVRTNSRGTCWRRLCPPIPWRPAKNRPPWSTYTACSMSFPTIRPYVASPDIARGHEVGPSRSGKLIYVHLEPTYCFSTPRMSFTGFIWVNLSMQWFLRHRSWGSWFIGSHRSAIGHASHVTWPPVRFWFSVRWGIFDLSLGWPHEYVQQIS